MVLFDLELYVVTCARYSSVFRSVPWMAIVDMPRIKVNGVELHYAEAGSGAETIVFAHGLLWSGRQFEPQVHALKSRYRCIAFDFRGQGKSEKPATGYDIDTLTKDAAELIKALDAAPCHFLGLSMGGFVGLRLALDDAPLLRSLLLVGTSAEAEPAENLPRYRRLAWVARWLGMRLVVRKIMSLYFGPRFLADPTKEQLRAELRRQLISVDPRGARLATEGVISRPSILHRIHDIRVPTLILVGTDDVVTTPDKSRHIHERIAGSRLIQLPTGHTCTIEDVDGANEAIMKFLSEITDIARR
ncbi:MAG: 3-oxoadipate enol-lactonase [Gemmatales bacterium]|nr:MAG: 3-oxoadipate enol-lactonase [Gemmatales bacterium]